MKIIKLFYLFIIVFTCNTLLGQESIVFNKKFRFVNLGCRTADVKQTPDYGYIAVGNAAISIVDDLFLIYKTDSLGNLEWYNQFGMQASQLHGVDISPEGEYIAVGQTQDNDEWFRYATIIKFNTNGNSLWKKFYTLPVTPGGEEMSQSVFKDVICTKDSSIVAAGWCENGSYFDPFVIKTNLNGDTLWTWRPYAFQEGTGEEVNACLEAIIETPEGDYVVVGQADATVSLDKEYAHDRGIIIKISKDGELIFFKEFEDIDYTRFTDIDINEEGELAITGGIVGYYLDNIENALLLKTDANGDPLFCKEIYAAFNIWGRSVCFTSEGNIIIGGYNIPPDSEDWDKDILLQSYDPEGNLSWEKVIGEKDSYTDIGKIVQTNDNGFIIGGHYSDDTLSHSWLLKIDNFGNGVYDQGWVNSINEEQFNLDVSVYPNPADTYIKIELPEENDSYKIDIINLSGQVVYSEQSNSNKLNIQTSDLSQGIYLLNIQSENKVYTSKLIVKH